MIDILIVDDSITESLILKSLFETAKDFRVVGMAKNGKEAVSMAISLRPSLITMDINMPVMNGYEATHQIMQKCPTPIVVISSTIDSDDLNSTFHALTAGAVSVLAKPYDVMSLKQEAEQKKLLNLLRAMSKIKFPEKNNNVIKPKKLPAILSEVVPKQKPHYELLAIGASVGGPEVLKAILTDLPKTFPVPIVIVQHITSGFIEGFVQWLNEHTHVKVKLAKQQEELKPGVVYFAPDHCHLEIHRDRLHLVAKLTLGSPVDGFYPSITTLFNSIAKTCGDKAVGALLTGMGKDGAAGLLALKQANSLTFIQDEKSSVVFGMANVALSLQAVDHVLSIEQFSPCFKQLFKK